MNPWASSHQRLALGRGLAPLQAPPPGLLEPVGAGPLALAVLLGPLVYKVGINDIDFKARLATPSAAHPMGTDDLGRDMLARMLYGGRISLAVGLAAMLMALTVGVVIGAIAGMARGWVDAALMWVTDLFLSCRSCRCCCC
jgi:ABC-type dipeptide/oligopeptide/nickel transport system permease subunit